jgi:hypothetical protein
MRETPPIIHNDPSDEKPITEVEPTISQEGLDFLITIKDASDRDSLASCFRAMKAMPEGPERQAASDAINKRAAALGLKMR